MDYNKEVEVELFRRDDIVRRIGAVELLIMKEGIPPNARKLVELRTYLDVLSKLHELKAKALLDAANYARSEERDAMNMSGIVNLTQAIVLVLERAVLLTPPEDPERE